MTHAPGGHVVLGIDAAWTLHNPSGVALVKRTGARWRLLTAAASYDAFLGGSELKGGAADARALIARSQVLAGHPLDLVAIDMPLSQAPITCRRASDDAVSRAYGARHCSTHTPSVTRPGPISDRLRAGFEVEGYGLCTNAMATPGLIEVYPHPALVELAAAPRRLPYKESNRRKYWPDLTPAARTDQLLTTWRQIVDLLEGEIDGVSAQLEPPVGVASRRDLKAFEDKLDAVVCAWVAICALENRATPFGDEESAIWIPAAKA